MAAAATAASLFGGVDRAIFASAFAGRLRRAGIEVAVTAVERCAAALDAVGAPTLGDLYWLTRISFVSRHTDLPAFDAVFASVFDLEAGRLPVERRGRQPESPGDADDRLVPVRRPPASGPATTGGVPWATLPSTDLAEGAGEDRGDETVLPELRPSATAAEMDRPFDLLDDDELARVGELLEAAMTQRPQRRSRRRRPARSGGPVSLRRSMRRSMHTGGDVLRLIHTKRRLQPRRVVVVLDVSGSMESAARAYLHLIRPLAVDHRAEVFAFATELSRITPAVRSRTATEAIEHMSDQVGDRFSGTRVASSLRTLLHHRTWSTCVRGAVVVICSDGWDADEPRHLERTMRRLALLAHRVVWVNPRAAAARFEPLAGGMAAALPFCDEFLAGATGRSMCDVIAAIAAA